MKRVPRFISKRYTDGAHGFRKEKRRLVKELGKVLFELRGGCAYFPCGPQPVDDIQKNIDILRDSLSVKNWGH